jgi:hypothetical protein
VRVGLGQHVCFNFGFKELARPSSSYGCWRCTPTRTAALPTHTLTPTQTHTYRQTKPPPKPRQNCRSRLIRRKRGAHVGLVGGVVGARPVREVGDKDEEGGRVVLGVKEEDSGGH